MIGGDYFAKHVNLLATGGRLVHIAFSHGSQVTVDLRAVMIETAADHRVDPSPPHGGRKVLAGASRGAGTLATVRKRTAAASRR